VRASVLITAYRRRRWLGEAVASALRQTEPVEVVVVKEHPDPEDDAWRGQGVRVVNEDLPVVGEVFVRGLAECHGDVVCFLDDDDMFVAGKAEEVLRRFREKPRLSMVRNSQEPVNPDGSPREWRRQQPTREMVLDSDSPEALDEAIHAGALVNLSTMSVRRSAVWERRDLLARVEYGTDFSMAVLMLDSGGRIWVTPQRLTIRRFGTSVMVKGVGGEALRCRRAMQAILPSLRTDLAAQYARRIAAAALVDAYMNGAADMPLSTFVRTVWTQRRRAPDAVEQVANGLLRRVAPGIATRLYTARRGAWSGEARRS
jgi:Glycosyl transferase family 2